MLGHRPLPGIRSVQRALFLITALGAAHPALAANPAGELGGSIFQLLLGLGLVLALMMGSLWLLKRLVAPRGEGAGLLRVVAGAAVGTRERVVVVEVGSTWLVLGVAPGSVSALAEVPRQALPPAPVAAPPDFPDWLRRLLQKR